MYTAEILVNTKANLEKIFQSEEKNINERAQYTLTKNKDVHVFRIEAKDATALRIVVGSITKVLSVHEKTLEVIEKNK
ncbi:MAG: KEOPS complex subunit Pcc1 [Nanoarchaeota archaeon]